MFHINTTSVDELIQILKGKKLPTGHVSTRKDGSQWRKKDDKKGGKGNWIMVKGPTKGKKATDAKPKKARSENLKVESKPKKAEKNPKKIAELINNATPENRLQTTESLYGTGTFRTKQEAREALVKNSLSIDFKTTPELIPLKVAGNQNSKPQGLDVRNLTREPILYKKGDNISLKNAPVWMRDYLSLGKYSGRVPCVPYRDEKGNPCYIVSAKITESFEIMNAEQIHSIESFYSVATNIEHEKKQNRSWLMRFHDLAIQANGSAPMLKQDAIEPYTTTIYRGGTTELVSKKRVNWNKLSEEDWQAEEKHLQSQMKDADKKNLYDSVVKYRYGKLKKPKRLGANKMLYKESELMSTFSEEAFRKPEESHYHGEQKKWDYYRKFREELGYSLNDLQSVGEEMEFNSTYDKGRQTSYGDTGTTSALDKKYGIQAKMQNGSVVTKKSLGEIENAIKDVYSVFGDRSEMSRKWGLKISHAGEKNMHARKAAGIFFPAFHAIGVSWADNPHLTLAHEFGHFMDHYLGKELGYHYITSGHGLESKIAKAFRDGMDKKERKPGYWTRSTECFARAMQCYYDHKKGNTHDDWEGKNPPEKYYKETIVPMIDEFFRTRNDVLKSAFNILMGRSK